MFSEVNFWSKPPEIEYKEEMKTNEHLCMVKGVRYTDGMRCKNMNGALPEVE